MLFKLIQKVLKRPISKGSEDREVEKHDRKFFFDHPFHPRIQDLGPKGAG